MRIDRRAAVTALFATTLLLAPMAPGAALVEPDDDPDLEQTIDPDQDVATDEVVLDLGHVDMGPRFENDAWALMVHDDTRLEGSVWRLMDHTVIHVHDAAQLTVPDDETYAFLDAEPGEQVHVIPQTQNAEVVWLGWNTQAPEVIERLDRGMTLTLDGVTGPGSLLVYLQDGGFGPPQTLWDSRQPERQDLWVDVNTHTHANWVFSEPGVYLVELTASADLVDGSAVEDTQVLRFSVGDDTDPAEALAAEHEPRAADGGQDEAVEDTESEGVSWLLWSAIGAAIVVGLLAGVFLTSLRNRRAKQAAVAAGSGAVSDSGGES